MWITRGRGHGGLGAPAGMAGLRAERRLGVMGVRVLWEAVPYRGRGPAAFAPLRGLPFAFWLDSAAPGPYGRYSLMGADPFAILLWRNHCGGLALRRPVGVALPCGRRMGGDALGCLERLLRWDGLRIDGATGGAPPFAGGAAGFLSYDLGRSIEPYPPRARDDLAVPDLYLCFYDHGIVIDHAEEMAYAYAVAFGPDSRDASRRLGRLVRGLRQAGRLAEGEAPGAGRGAGSVGRSPGEAPPGLAGAWRSNFTREMYCRMVARAKEYIARGEIYQVNLSQRLEAEWAGDPFPVYLRLREAVPEPFGAYLGFPGIQVASASPELFLRLEGDRVVTRPIKGTRPRGRDAATDRALREELLASAKDRAELLMIVDLERNDLGRVCRTGTVTVPELRAVESHPRVHHLVATVEGRLAPGRGPVDVLRATFPGGSITGAPKRRAMEIIEELEPVRRGVYTGAIGFIGFDGSMELSIAIRTLVFRGGRVFLHVGGGVVADSDPLKEYEETLHKAAGLVEAVGLR